MTSNRTGNAAVGWRIIQAMQRQRQLGLVMLATFVAASSLCWMPRLRALEYVFQQGEKERGALLEAARRAMYNIDEACRALSLRQNGALFRPPAWLEGEAPVLTAHAVGDPLRAHLHAMRTHADIEMQNLAGRMEAKLDDLTSRLASATPPA